MNDFGPEETGSWQYLEALLRQLMHSYGYREIRTPIVEQTALFKRSIGEVTDIVEKEMYTWTDISDDSLTLRPEGTASCVRAGIENGWLYNQQQKLWYMGPMFRREKPQKGRYRQFHQLGVEAFGFDGPDVDVEQILLTKRLWKWLGIENDVVLHINSLGDLASRNKYREVLVQYFESNSELLDEDSKRRLHTNPMRILDSKNPVLKEMIAKAPKLTDYLDEASANHFNELKQRLDGLNIAYVENPCLVRGLDYYNRTVFEWMTDKLGAQGTICAGGRYDGLTEQLGGQATPACGFAMGLERIAALVEETNQQQTDPQQADLYFIHTGEQAELVAIKLAEELRQNFSRLNIMVNCGGGNFKKQFKKADRSGAVWALIIGEDEAEKQQVSIKFLREQAEQQTVLHSELKQLISNQLWSKVN